MKKKISILMIAVTLLSCESFVTGIDEQDPTRATDASLQQVYIGMETEFAGTMEGSAARLAGIWSGYFSGTDRQYVDIQNYNVNAATFDDPWSNMYVFTMVQVQQVKQKAAELSNTNALGAAQVVEAFTIGTAATLWGDIPYSQAWKNDEFPNPTFDTQNQVIDNVITLLNTAIANLTLNSGNFPGEILVAGVTSAKWIKIANTLKARILLYKKDYTGAAAAAALGVTSTADQLRMLHGISNNIDRNIYYDFMFRQRSGYMGGNAFLQTLMNSRGNAKTNDLIRRAFYYEGGTGVPRTTTGGAFATDATFNYVTASENLLIRAEAEALSSNSISAAALAALNAHRAILRAAYPTGNYADYLATDFTATTGIENNGSDGVVTTDLDAFIREVRQEKYVSLYGQIEVFNEIRRTNNAIGLTPVGGAPTLPQRFIISQNEINSNTSVPNPVPALTEKTAIFQ